MDSQHLFGAKGDTDSCLLLWAVHVSGVEDLKRGRWCSSWSDWWEGGVAEAVRSKTFWKKYTVSVPSPHCESVTVQHVGEVLDYTVYHKQMQAYTSHPGGMGFFLESKTHTHTHKSLIQQLIMCYQAEMYCVIARRIKFGFVHETGVIILIYDMHAQLLRIPKYALCMCVCVCF